MQYLENDGDGRKERVTKLTSIQFLFQSINVEM